MQAITIIIPSYNEGENLIAVLEELEQTLTTIVQHTFKLLIVDDGSSDNTVALALSAKLSLPLRIIRLSRNFGKEAAMSAGLQACTQDNIAAAIIMDADGQHPPECINFFIEFWQKGNDIVYAKRDSRKTDSFIRRKLSNLYYKMLPQEAKYIESNAGDFRLLSIDVIKALNDLPERSRFMKGLYNWVGFKKYAIDYIPRKRLSGNSKFNLLNLFRFGMVGLTAFSTLPLRLITHLGAIVACSALLYGSYILVDTIINGADLPGWATLTTGIMLLGGIQLISIGIVGEYVGHIFNEAKNRPLYIIAEDITNESKTK